MLYLKIGRRNKRQRDILKELDGKCSGFERRPILEIFLEATSAYSFFQRSAAPCTMLSYPSRKFHGPKRHQPINLSYTFISSIPGVSTDVPLHKFEFILQNI